MSDQGAVTALSVSSSLFLLANVWLVLERNSVQGGLFLPSHWTNQYVPSQYPVGAVQASVDPTLLGKGWMKADGSLLHQVHYAELYSALGVFYCTTEHVCGDEEFRLPNMTKRSLSHNRGQPYGGRAEVAVTSVPSHEHKLSSLSGFDGQCAMAGHEHEWNTETGTENEQHTHETICAASTVGINPGRDAAHNHGAPDIKLGAHSGVHRHRHSCPMYSVPSVAFLHPDRAEPKAYCKPDDGENCNVCRDSNCPHRATARYCSWSTADHAGGATPRFTDIREDRLQTPLDGSNMKATPSWNTNHADHPSGGEIERPADGSHSHTFSKWDNMEGGAHAHTIAVSARPSPFASDSAHSHVLSDTKILLDAFDHTHTHSQNSMITDKIGDEMLSLSRSEFDLKYYIKAY